MSNKYQEAFRRLKNDIERGNCDYNVEPYLAILQELVDKETPRTEQEILKDFEKLGYEIRIEQDFIDMNIYDDISLFIDLKYKTYSKSKYLYVEDLTMQEHKLLNELFTIWGWL